MIIDRFRPLLINSTKDLGESVRHLLEHTENASTAEHVRAVAAEASRLAQICGDDPISAETVGWLHDLSAIIPTSEYLTAALELGVEVLPEEKPFPFLLHQKLSAALAKELYGICDPDILSAIGCHTTLKPGASLLDKTLFIADKLSWDRADSAPFRQDLLCALDRSLDDAVMVYLSFIWEQRETLEMVHPWLVGAYLETINNK